ncbi:MAG: hypothetical protein KBH07_08655 [Flavobacteriales bacterium]|nr:hypothetical protein [Flavobacteriales bacterium]MBP9079526.1 hypothetical protein [Flavobacteriales bacterium]
MKILLDIKENKAEFVLELLRNLRFVKATPLTDTKAKVLSDLRDAVEEVKQIKAGKKHGRPARELLEEL